MSFHVPNKSRVRTGRNASEDFIGNNGAFMFKVQGIKVFCVVSDKFGWDHVSISRLDQKMPNWNIMCAVKELFWDEDDCIIQYHPAKKDYINIHATCLHMWRCTGQEFPTPPKILIG